MKTKLQLLAIGKQYSQLCDLEDRARDARKKFREACLGGQQFWSSASRGDTGIVMNISLAEYLAQFPEEKPVFQQWDSETHKKKMGRMKYPAKCIGLIRVGYWFWVEAHTEDVPVADLPANVDFAVTPSPTSPSLLTPQAAA